MQKEKRILSYFLGWLLIGFVLFFIGITNSLALETNFENLSVQGYDNSGSSLTVPDVFNCSAGSCGMEITTTANSYGGAWGIQSPIPLISNHSYAITLRIRNSVNAGIVLSSKPQISVGNSMNSAKYNYESSNFWNTTLYSSATGNMTLQYVIKLNGPASYLIIPFTTSSTFTASFMIDSIIIEDLGTESLTQDEINNSLNNQTNELNNSINNAQNNINQNIDDMEQNIIDSNKETQDVIKDQFNTCNIYKPKYISSLDNVSIFINPSNNNVTFSSTNGLKTFVYEIPVINNVYTFTFNNTNRLRIVESDILYTSLPTGAFNVLYNTDKPIVGKTYTITPTKKYIYVYLSNDIENSGSITFNETEICSNKIDETNDKLDDIEGALTDSSAPNTDGLSGAAGWLPQGPLDTILNLPLTMLNSLTNSLGKTCSPLNIPLPYINKNIQIPCLSTIFSQITGVNGLWSWVGTIASVLILYNYLLNLYAWVDRVLTLRAEFDEAMGADLSNWGRL